MSKFGLNTGKYGPEITPYFDTFHAVQWMGVSLGDPRILPQYCLCLLIFLESKAIVQIVASLSYPHNLTVRVEGDHHINLFWPLTWELFRNFYPPPPFLSLVIKVPLSPR